MVGALADGRFYQLTWKAGRVLVYDADSLAQVHEYRYQCEGWCLPWDGTHLIMSDGSATLRFIDPDGFKVVRRLQVRENADALANLNELEYIDGEIWANLWFSDRIVRIDPDSGAVVAHLDAAPLRAAGVPSEAVKALFLVSGPVGLRAEDFAPRRWLWRFWVGRRTSCLS